MSAMAPWRALPGTALDQRADHDADIQPQRPLVDVSHIEVEPLPQREPAAAVDLGQTRDARAHLMPPPMVRAVAGQVLHEERAWSDQAHASPRRPAESLRWTGVSG